MIIEHNYRIHHSGYLYVNLKYTLLALNSFIFKFQPLNLNAMISRLKHFTWNTIVTDKDNTNYYGF